MKASVPYSFKNSQLGRGPNNFSARYLKIPLKKKNGNQEVIQSLK